MTDDSLPPGRRHEVEAIAERSAIDAVKRFLRERRASIGGGVTRRDALRVGGFGGLLAAFATAGGATVERAGAQAGNGRSNPRLGNLVPGQWNREDAREGTVIRPAAPDHGTLGPAVTDDGTVYCFGEDRRGEPQLAAYDLTANTWSRRRAPRNPTSGGGAAVDGDAGVAYVAAPDRFFEYDLDGNAWSPRSGTPWGDYGLADASGSALAFADGRAFRFGGTRSGGVSSAAVEAYDPDDDEWTSVTPMPKPRSNHAAVAYGGDIYVVGGQEITDARTSPLSRVQRYDPAAGDWTGRADLPLPTATHGLAVVAGRLYVVGGTAAPVQVYDVASNAWGWYPGAYHDPAGYPAVGSVDPPDANGRTVFAFGGRGTEFRADAFGALRDGGEGDGDEEDEDDGPDRGPT